MRSGSTTEQAVCGEQRNGLWPVESPSERASEQTDRGPQEAGHGEDLATTCGVDSAEQKRELDVGVDKVPTSCLIVVADRTDRAALLTKMKELTALIDKSDSDRLGQASRAI